MNFNELTLSELIYCLNSYIANAEKLGKDYAVKRADFEQVEDKKKPYLAVLMSRHSGAQNLKEQLALASNEWMVFLEGLAEERKAFYQAEVDYDMARLKVDTIRTVISTRREEIKNFKG